MLTEEEFVEASALHGRDWSISAIRVAVRTPIEGFQTAVARGRARGVRELDLDIGGIRIAVVEDTKDVHNVIVCTLCSCYPRGLLGLPPDWYKARSYRSRVVRDPSTVLAEFGTELPDDVEVRVHDSTADLRYLVLPLRPAGTEGMTEDELAALVTRDCLIGVTLPRVP